MKTTQQSAAKLRAIIRWTTGGFVAITIITGACVLFPLLSSLPALALTGCLSLFIGLNIALPPLDPEDDWVSIHPRMEEASEVVEKATKREQAVELPAAARLDTTHGFEVLPVHHKRSSGAPTGTWNVFHPEVQHAEDAHKITLNHRVGHGRTHRKSKPVQSETN